MRDVEGVLHLAPRIRSLDEISDPDVWRENDRLRSEASRILVDAGIAAAAEVYVQPTVTFVYPPDGAVSEDTPVGEVLPILRSALAAEQQAERFARAGGRGVVLRFGRGRGCGARLRGPRGRAGRRDARRRRADRRGSRGARDSRRRGRLRDGAGRRGVCAAARGG